MSVSLPRQKQDTLLQTAMIGPMQNVQMKRLIGVLADQVQVLSERSRVTLVGVKDVGKPTFFHYDGSRFYEWTTIMQKCGRNVLEAWRGRHKRSDPFVGGSRRNLLRALMAPQLFVRYKKNAKIGEVELADDIKFSAVGSMVLESLAHA